MEAGAWRQRRRQARGGPRPSPEGQRHSHHHVQRPDVRRTRGTASATWSGRAVAGRQRTSAGPKTDVAPRCRSGVAVPVWTQCIAYARGGNFTPMGKPRTTANTRATVSERLPMRWAQRRSTSWPDRRGSRRGRTRDAGDRDGSRSHANPTHAYYVVHALTELTEIRIESDDCWDDVRRRPKREHFSRRNVGTFPESSTLPERERDCMQERHTRRLSRV